MIGERDDLPEDDHGKSENRNTENQTDSEQGEINVATRDEGPHLDIKRRVAMERTTGTRSEHPYHDTVENLEEGHPNGCPKNQGRDGSPFPNAQAQPKYHSGGSMRSVP